MVTEQFKKHCKKCKYSHREEGDTKGWIVNSCKVQRAIPNGIAYITAMWVDFETKKAIAESYKLKDNPFNEDECPYYLEYLMLQEQK